MLKRENLPGMMIGISLGGLVGTGFQFASGIQNSSEKMEMTPLNAGLVNMVSSIVGVALDLPISSGFGAGFFMSSIPRMYDNQ